MNPIYVYPVVEDELGEAVLQKVLEHSGRPYALYGSLGKRGKGYITSRIAEFNRAAGSIPFFILIDSDTAECAPDVVRGLLPQNRHRNLVLRVAIREAEAWLLADRSGFAGFLGVGSSKFPLITDLIPDPKTLVINLARRSRKKEVREGIVPAAGSTAKIGPLYNSLLTTFTSQFWDLDAAAANSDSLRRAIQAASDFLPAT